MNVIGGEKDGLAGLRIRTGDWAELGNYCHLVRHEVFVGEQGVPETLEDDGHDTECVHVVAFMEGLPVGTGRLFPDGHVGRIAVRKSWRGRGVGGAMLACLIEDARQHRIGLIELNAQTSALDFYRGLGFASVGAPFMEAGIPHQTMRLALD